MSQTGQPAQQQPAAAAAAPAAATFDIGAAFGTLSEENRIFAERKGWAKDGKPVETFKLDTLADSYRNLEKLQGGKTLAAPNPADPEAFAKWEGHALLGVPEKPEDYKFEKPKLPEGMEWGKDGVLWDDAGEKLLRTALRKGMIGQAQAQTIMNEIAQERVGQISAARQARALEAQTVTANLQRAFGAGLDGAKNAGKDALGFIAQKAGVDANKVIDGLAQVMGNEDAVRFTIQLGKMLGEDQLKGGRVAGFATGPDAAKAGLENFKADGEKVKALYDKANPRHKQVQEEWNRLWAQAQPGT